MPTVKRPNPQAPKRRPIRMTRKPLPAGAKTLLAAVFFTLVGLAWVWRLSWFEQTSNQLLALEKQERELQNEWANLQSELSQLSRGTIIEAEAKAKLGMIFLSVPPDTLWVDGPVEQPSLGSLAFLSPIITRERKLTRNQ